MVEALSRARSAARDLGIDLLDIDEVVIGSIHFLGGPLWTDYALEGGVREGMEVYRRELNDQRLIEVRVASDVRTFMPDHALEMNRAYVGWLVRKLEALFAGPTVVVTYHAPPRASIHPHYEAPLSMPASPRTSHG